MEKIARILSVGSSNDNIRKIISFDEGFGDKDEFLLLNDFGFGKSQITKSLGMYRNIALIIDLKKSEEEFTAAWDFFLDDAFPVKSVVSKLDNVFVNKEYNRLMVVTNRRLMMLDLKKVNEKLHSINTDIQIYNETREPEEAEQKPATLKERLRKIFIG